MFQFLKTTIRRLTHHNWRPHTVICDFEPALHCCRNRTSQNSHFSMLLPFLSKSVAKDPRAGIVCSLSPKPAAEDTVEKGHGAWIPATTAPEDELHSTVQCQAHDSPHEQVPRLAGFLAICPQHVR